MSTTIQDLYNQVEMKPNLDNNLISTEIARQLQQISNTANNQKMDIPMAPRTIFMGNELPMTVVEAYAEDIMNVFDVSTLDASRSITMCMYSKATGGGEGRKTTEIIMEDDGPALPTGLNSFMENYMKIHVMTKTDNNKQTIGNAGIGAKASHAKLGKRHHYSWSEGNGHPICNFIIDEDTFDTLNSYDYKEEPYKGDSFFKVSITKLRNNKIKTPSEVRDHLESKFAGTLKTHTNVSIYTCRPNNVSKNIKLTSPPEEKYISGYRWEGVVDFGGLDARVSVGLLNTEKSTSFSPAIRISRNGVVHFELRDSKAHSLVFTKSNGVPTTFGTRHRDILVKIESKHLDSSQIKNDLQWDKPNTNGLLRAIGKNSNFREMIAKIVAYNNKRGTDFEKIVSNSYQEKLDKLKIAAAEDFSKIPIDSKITNYTAPTTPIDSKTAKPQKRRPSTLKKNKNKKNINTNGKFKEMPKIKAGGKDYGFDIKFMKDTKNNFVRSWLTTTGTKFIININCDYDGYTDKISKDEKKEAVYVADTVGQAYQDYRLKMSLRSDNPVTSEVVEEIQSARDAIVAKCMPIISG